MTEDPWDRRYQREGERFDARPGRTVLRWAVYATVLALGVAAIFGVGSWVFGWGSQPARIYGVKNVRGAWAFFYRYDKDLTAQARIVCQTVRAQKRGTQLADGALLAYEQTYERIAAEYNAEASNKLEKGLVRPPGVPRTAPSLQEKVLAQRQAGDPSFDGCTPGDL